MTQAKRYSSEEIRQMARWYASCDCMDDEKDLTASAMLYHLCETEAKVMGLEEALTAIKDYEYYREGDAESAARYYADVASEALSKFRGES